MRRTLRESWSREDLWYFLLGVVLPVLLLVVLLMLSGNWKLLGQ
jgi:hypothetical protein